MPHPKDAPDAINDQNNVSQNTTEDQKQTNFDPNEFKQSIMNDNKLMLEQALSQMKNIVDTGINSIKNTAPSNPSPVSGAQDIDSDFREEAASLGLDAEQTKAMLGFMQKVIAKKAPEQTEKILNQVDQNFTIKEQKKIYEDKIKSKFPKFFDQNSELFKKTRDEFNTMTEEERRSPAAAWNAVSRAAAELNIAPAIVNPPVNTIFGANGPSNDPNKTTKDELELASFFGVEADDYKEAKKQSA